MNATIKVVAGVMSLRAKFAHTVLGYTSKVREVFMIATRGVFAYVATLMVGHLRNGGTSLSSVTPDFN